MSNIRLFVLYLNSIQSVFIKIIFFDIRIFLLHNPHVTLDWWIIKLYVPIKVAYWKWINRKIYINLFCIWRSYILWWNDKYIVKKVTRQEDLWRLRIRQRLKTKILIHLSMTPNMNIFRHEKETILRDIFRHFGLSYIMFVTYDSID